MKIATLIVFFGCCTAALAASPMTDAQLDGVIAGQEVVVSGSGSATVGSVSTMATAGSNGVVAHGVVNVITHGVDPTATTTVSGTDLLVAHTVTTGNDQVAHSISVGVAK